MEESGVLARSGYRRAKTSQRGYARRDPFLPDYDGPPMRAPSGLVVRFPCGRRHRRSGACGPSRMRTHLRAQGYGLVYLDDDRHDGMRAYRRFGVQMLFDRPGEGGRGWCPKAGGVQI